MRKAILLTILLFTNAIIFATDKDNSSSIAELSDYVGIYKMESFFSTVKVEIKDGKLHGTVDENGTFLLNEQPEADTFKSTSSYGTIYLFKRDPNTKKVVSVTLKLMDQEVSGAKQN